MDYSMNLQTGKYIINPHFFSSQTKYKYIGNHRNKYKIIHFNKNIKDCNDTTLALYRSVVVGENYTSSSSTHIDQSTILCISPPKSTNMDCFINKYPEKDGIISEDILINEIIEGVMINLFYDIRNNTWELATKNNIGAKYQYYHYNIQKYHEYINDKNPKINVPLTFRDMFMEAIGEPHYTDINRIGWISNLNKSWCYSFVLQHPQNHIILPTFSAKLFLTTVYEIKYETIFNANTSTQPFYGYTVTYIPFETIEQYGLFKDTNVLFPKNYDHLRKYTYQDIQKIYCSEYAKPNSIGIMFTHKQTGERMAMQNMRYQNIKENRRYYSHMLYLYLNLLYINKLHDIYCFFPVYKMVFSQYSNMFDNLISSIYNAYVSFYIKKNVKISFDTNIKCLIKKIHNDVYIRSIVTSQNSIDSIRPSMTRFRIEEYILNQLTPTDALYYMIQLPYN